MEVSKWMIAFVAAFNFGGLVADAIAPQPPDRISGIRWPSHAKFHNGQTMLMGIFGGSLSLAILFGARPLTLPLFLIATGVAASYFVAMVFAPAFPGTDWIDPEFKAETGRPLGLAPQQLVTYVLAAWSSSRSPSPFSHDGGFVCNDDKPAQPSSNDCPAAMRSPWEGGARDRL